MINKRGFTLVELLAVIVILALLIVITANTVLPMMKKTKINAMVVYAEKVLDKASAAYIVDNMTNGGSEEYYSIEKLMGQDKYYGVVKVETIDSDYIYSIALFDAEEELGLKMVGLDSNSMDGDVNAFVKSAYYNSLIDTKDIYDTDEECENYEFNLKTNLIDFSSLTVDHYVRGSNSNVGALTSISQPWRSTDYILVEFGKTYKFTVKKTTTTTVAGYAWYDEHKTAISGGSYTADVLQSINSNGYFLLNAPTNARFLRVSWRVDEGNSDFENTVSLVKQ